MSHLRRRSLRVALGACIVSLLACAAPSMASAAIPAEKTVSAVPLTSMTATLSAAWSGFDRPLYVTAPAGDTTRTFVVEKGGVVKIAKPGGVVEAQPFIDVSGLVSSGSEQGLLGLAFSPEYLTNGRLYLSYTATNGDTVIARYRTIAPASDTPTFSAGVVYRRSQPYANHNGGCIQFGPDRMLYIGLGDGGSAGDPGGRAQNLNTTLGKLLRIDVGETAGAVSVPLTYRIPRDNPYYGQANRKGGIWASGLRNPWRFSFDRVNGTMWIGDVGQNRREEIDRMPLGSKGYNFGWNRYEGLALYPVGSKAPANPSRFTKPVTTHAHPSFESITGGYVYRGTNSPALFGTYVYGDFVTGRLYFLRRTSTTVTRRQMLDTNLLISSFGEDAAGELYLTDLIGGTVYRVDAQ